MKKRWGKLWAAVLVFALLVPIYGEMDDGGSKEYRALLYRVRKLHSIRWEGEDFGYLIGTEVSILGIEMYSDVKFISVEAVSEKE